MEKKNCIRFENDESEILKRLHSFVFYSIAREFVLDPSWYRLAISNESKKTFNKPK